MTSVVGHVVRMACGQCAPNDMGGGWVCKVWGQGESRTGPSDTTRSAEYQTCFVLLPFGMMNDKNWEKRAWH
jgi:hypothetical protein